MKNERLIAHLNYAHLSLIGTVIIAFLTGLLLITSWQSKVTEDASSKKQFIKLASVISNDLDKIKSIPLEYKHISDNQIYTDTCLKNIFKTYDLIGKIIVLNNNSNFKLETVFNNENSSFIIQNLHFPEDGFSVICATDSSCHLCYFRKITPDQSLLIILKHDWLNRYINYPGVDNALALLFYDVNSNLLVQTSPIFIGTTTKKKLLINYFSDIPNNKAKETITTKFAIDGKNEFIQLYHLGLLDKNGILALIIPNHSFLTFHIWYLTLCIAIGLILFVISFFVVFAINKQVTLPVNDLINSINLSKELQLGIHKDENELDLINKYIGILESKVEFYEKKLDNISTESKNLVNDLKLANRLQKNLFPANILTFDNKRNFSIHATSSSAYEVGGDLYDCFLIDDDHLVVLVADVAGKGIAASLYMIYTHTLLRSIIKTGLHVSEIVQRLNNQLIEENLSDMFVTMFIGILTLSDGYFEYCNAAHTLPCLITATGDVFELSETHGIPIGIYPDRPYLFSSINFNNGDQIFIYTDGLTDTIDENGIKYSSDVLKYNLMGSWFNTPQEVTNRIINSVNHFRGNNRPVDDMTILTLKYSPSDSKS